MKPLRILFSLFFLSYLSFLTGCSGFSHFKASHFIPKPQQADILTHQEKHLARLVIYRPRESLFALPSSKRVELYADQKKLADLQAGRYLVLDAPNLPRLLTLHWFDKKHPKISRIIELDLRIKPGQQGVLKLSYEKDENAEEILVASNIDQTDAQVALPWLIETQPVWTQGQEQIANSF